MKTLLIGASLALALTAGPVLAQDCTPSKYGPADEIGAANLVTPERVLAATKLVKHGKSHPLGIVVVPGMPAYPPRSVSLQVVQPNMQFGKSGVATFGWDIIGNDDLAQLWFGVGPQLDGLGHVGEGKYFYNCHNAQDISPITGLTKLGTHGIPPLIGRGVLLDMAKHKGVPAMAAGDIVAAEDLPAAAKAQGVTFKEGDIILIHTGWTDAKLASDPKAWVSGEPGLDNAAAVYLAGLNPIAVGADTWGVEAVPPKQGDKIFYGHVTLLKENGIYILETMNTGPLVAQGVNEFLFVLGQARIQGAVQMIINPVALW
jgi:kynurenine formamidase